MNKKAKSGTVIAKMLGVEGFSKDTASLVKKWVRKRIYSQRSRARTLAKSKKAFQEQVVPKLTDADRIVLGEYMGKLFGEQFEAGVRIGLAASLWGSELLDGSGAAY